MRFLCDAMLGGLARWLRAAGYDSLFADGGWDDRELVDLCGRDDRVLLTKGGQLALSARDTIQVLLLGSRGMDGNARELRERLALIGNTPRSRAALSTTPWPPAQWSRRQVRHLR